MSFPQTESREREQAIIDLVKAGQAQYEYSTVNSKCEGHEAQFFVFSDSLKVPVNDKLVRVNVSAWGQQQIADVLGCYLLTAKLADLIWLQRNVTLLPFPRQITASTDAMIEHSEKIDAVLTSLGNPQGLLCTVGKHWILENDTLSHSGSSCNYGWHFAGPSFQGITGELCVGMMKDASGQYMRLIQGRGWAHDIDHADYSQVCVLVGKQCIVDGNVTTIDKVAQDAVLSCLMNYSGILKILRQPGT